MFQQLTAYLLQFNRVVIPSVGTIELVAQPAQLDIVHKQIHPPCYHVRFLEKEEMTPHQLAYFEAQGGNGTTAQGRLQKMGAELRNRIHQTPFNWNGIGTFAYGNDGIEFKPDPAVSACLQPVQAERVLRQNVQHQVQVGDQVILSDGTLDDGPARKRPYTTIIAWILCLAALLFILYYFYGHHFEAAASGLQQKVTPAPAPATYK